jgi:hypothetical protein
MDEAPKRRLAKQRFVTEHLKSAFPNIRWTVDRRIKGGNSARRPDLIWDFGTFVIIVEIDEDQHKTYDKEDLKLREKELLSDLKGKKLVIIYFNPDEYTDKDGKIHPSIFFVERGEAYPLVGWRERFNVLVINYSSISRMKMMKKKIVISEVKMKILKVKNLKVLTLTQIPKTKWMRTLILTRLITIL